MVGVRRRAAAVFGELQHRAPGVAACHRRRQAHCGSGAPRMAAVMDEGIRQAPRAAQRRMHRPGAGSIERVEADAIAVAFIRIGLGGLERRLQRSGQSHVRRCGDVDARAAAQAALIEQARAGTAGWPRGRRPSTPGVRRRARRRACRRPSDDRKPGRRRSTCSMNPSKVGAANPFSAHDGFQASASVAQSGQPSATFMRNQDSYRRSGWRARTRT